MNTCPMCAFMTDLDKRDYLLRWIIENVSADLVPADEGSSIGLVYNMVQQVLRTGKTYRYEAGQVKELKDLCRRLGIHNSEIIEGLPSCRFTTTNATNANTGSR